MAISKSVWRRVKKGRARPPRGRREVQDMDGGGAALVLKRHENVLHRSLCMHIPSLPSL